MKWLCGIPVWLDDRLFQETQERKDFFMERMTRRRFVNTTVKTAATLAATSGCLATSNVTGAQSANDKVVLALIGCGGRGGGLANNFLQVPNVEFKYTCDAFRPRAELAAKNFEKKQGRAPTPIQDLRTALDDKDVTAVVIATPEHWHALGTVWACQAGKDVYVEKNPSLSIGEGRKMIEAARKYNRIVQAGFQNRSGPYAASAREYLQSGQLGRIVLVKVFNLLEGGGWSPQPDGPPPTELDWDIWLGPASEVPYNRGRQNGWGDWFDYSGGAFSGDASHQLDLTRMALGDPPHPKAVHCVGGRRAYPDSRQMPDILAVTYDYGDFVMVCENGTFTPYMKKFPPEVRYGTTWPNWPQSSCRAEIYGTKQLMYLGRHGCGWQVLEASGKVVAQDKGYFPDKWHQPNFIHCIRSRKQPNADIEQAHFSACLIHLGMAAYRTGNQRLVFDGTTETFVGNDDANQLLKLAGRKHYRIPEQV
jgi:predicted dehydrogenase